MGATVADDGQWRFPVSNDIPEKFAVCLTQFEDKRFYYHPGVDVFAIGRAALSNIKSKRVVSGASTLDMQVIRMSTRKERNRLNKFLEIIQALRLNMRYSKAEILSLYATHAPFGGNVVGLEAACWRYFGRAPEDITWAEAATLAVLPNAPSLIHPGRNRILLLKKRNRLLEILNEKGIISNNDLPISLLEPLPEAPLSLPSLAPHLLQWHRKNYRNAQAEEPLLKSSMQAELQKQVNELLIRHYQELSANEIHNISMVVVDVKQMQIIAYAGNVPTEAGAIPAAFVDIARTRRSPGSLLKPLLYAALLEDGLITPQALIPDIPTQMAGYVPQNFDLQYDGAVKASEVVSRSLNIPSVKMLQMYHYARFHQLLKKHGLRTLDKPASHYGLSLILGGGEITLLDIIGLYAGMAHHYAHAQDSKGYPALTYTPNKSQKTKDLAFNRAVLWEMFACMEDVIRPGDEGYWQQFQSSRRVAWKTGTSFGFRDAWAVGITPDYAIGVWVGNAGGEGRPNLIGVRTAAPIMFEAFSYLPAGPWFDAPETGQVSMEICRHSGFKAGAHCENVELKSVPKSCEKAAACPYHQLIHTDKTGFRVSSECASTEEMQVQRWFVLPPVMEHYYRIKHFDYQPLPEFRSDCGMKNAADALEIVYPPDGSVIRLPKELSGIQQSAIFRATHRRKNEVLYWSLSGQHLGTTTGSHQMPVNPEPGNYVLTVTDSEGLSRQVKFSVK